jgi:hypothetical protein
MGRFDATVRPFLQDPERPPEAPQTVGLGGLDGFEAKPAGETGARLPISSLDPDGPVDFGPTELKVAWLPYTLWVVPDETAGVTLAAEGISRGRIWTAGELADVLRIPGITRDRARMIAGAKLEFDGEVTNVRAAQPLNSSTMAPMQSGPSEI